ncbi:hypothetical protein SELMODRAFT_442161 [Selaginella moellendorffii]|uniref:SPRY domain-containing protein n=1 Tax=Selaginella moellendorffii TaxID=88036 RepID=D8RRA1_SELML|nr:uncharacterized protein LOC9642614 [Selaginella moellendorffii]EFJ25363.1 hypothetical protein SELMODRAFT_442161 [Selaginella moellendorffii]|eukprot:XP_002973703.1 uncharacterized protein LOC9642614 [Selaginella moellendorffii]
MQTWRKIALAVGLPIASLLLATLVITCVLRALKTRRFPKHPRLPRDKHDLDGDGGGGLFPYDRSFSGMKGLDLAAMEGIQMAARWRGSYPVRSFDWLESTYLLADAIDRGWAAFAFTYHCSSQCPVSSADAFVLCTKCCLGEAFQPEIAWEIGPGSDYMQLIRLNPRLARPAALQLDADVQVVLIQALQSALPLPGPPSGAFPPEGYFEITIVAVGSEERSVLASEISSSTDSENMKLILRPSPSEKYPLTQSGSKGNGFHQRDSKASSTKKIVQTRIQANGHDRKAFDPTTTTTTGIDQEDGNEKTRTLGVGFSPSAAPPFRLPGLEQGSVGLHSDGRIFLNGMLQVDSHDSKLLRKKKFGWASTTNTTIGCGYSPQSRRFFFTLDGELVGELSCNDGSSREFGYPLHATVASNYDVTLLVNFGQCSFEFMPANDHRAADPSSYNGRSNTTTTTTTTTNVLSSASKSSTATNGGEGSELFSIRRLDSHWWSGRRTSSLSHPEAESDLFEISLG